MGLIAYDLDKKTTIDAAKAVKKKKGRYICPFCTNRNVPVYLSEKQTGAIFVTYPNSQHEENCDFPTSYESTYHNAILEKFSFVDIYNNAINQIKHGDSNNRSPYRRCLERKEKTTEKEITINSLYDLYRFCSSNEPTYSVEDYTIQDFFIALSTAEFWYSKRQEVDNVLVLAVGYNFQIMWKEHRIRLIIDKKRSLKISITFDDYKYFDLITTKIKSYATPEVKLFVSGYATSKEYSFKKNGNSITYSEITVNALENSIHFLSKKKNHL